MSPPGAHQRAGLGVSPIEVRLADRALTVAPGESLWLPLPPG
ncbi:hypothetical protein ABZS71_04795 [Streptomyces sp. NPDC005393]